MPLTAEVRDLLTLHLVPGLGPRLTAALLERFGSARAILQAAPDQLRQVPHIGDKLARNLSGSMRTVNVDDELTRMSEHSVRLLVFGSADYPAPLATIADPPHLLYCRGDLQSVDHKAVAIVGSRSCTSYGRRMAEKLARDLARRGYLIVSGLARGIDGVAHRAALDAGGRTVAVLAGGLSRIYPPEHADLARAVEQAGALVSEASMSAEPMAGMFPARNRIISGLSQAVIIVEAAQRSGALLTASHAGEQGRQVLAVPGPVDSTASGGTNDLIRKGAILVRSAEDVVEELEGVAAVVKAERADKPTVTLDPTEQRIWDFLADRAHHLDEMVQQLGLTVSQLSGLLMMLEMKKIVRRLPGNQYERAS